MPPSPQAPAALSRRRPLILLWPKGGQEAEPSWGTSIGPLATPKRSHGHSGSHGRGYSSPQALPGRQEDGGQPRGITGPRKKVALIPKEGGLHLRTAVLIRKASRIQRNTGGITGPRKSPLRGVCLHGKDRPLVPVHGRPSMPRRALVTPRFGLPSALLSDRLLSCWPGHIAARRVHVVPTEPLLDPRLPAIERAYRPYSYFV